MTDTENRNVIQAYLDTFEIDLFGVADIRSYGGEFLALENASIERYTSAFCFGFVLSKSVLDTVVDGPNPLYLHHYRQLNYRLDMTAYLLSKNIESRGYRALPVAASQVVDWQNQRGHLSHKHMGVAAGLGWIGKNNLLVNDRYGSQARYVTVLTDMPVAADTPHEGSCGDCHACVATCPAGAIHNTPEGFDHLGCFAAMKEMKNKKNLGHYICGICIESCTGKR